MNSSSHTLLHWIMVLPHPDDVITMYSCLPNDIELNNVYCQPSTEEIQHLICNMATPKYRQTRSLPHNTKMPQIMQGTLEFKEHHTTVKKPGLFQLCNNIRGLQKYTMQLKQLSSTSMSSVEYLTNYLYVWYSSTRRRLQQYNNNQTK